MRSNVMLMLTKVVSRYATVYFTNLVVISLVAAYEDSGHVGQRLTIVIASGIVMGWDNRIGMVAPGYWASRRRELR